MKVVVDEENKISQLITALQQFKNFDFDKVWHVGLNPVVDSAENSEESGEDDGSEYREDSSVDYEDDLSMEDASNNQQVEGEWTHIFLYQARTYVFGLFFAWYKKKGKTPRVEYMNFCADHQWILRMLLDHLNKEHYIPGQKDDNGEWFRWKNANGEGFNLDIQIFHRVDQQEQQDRPVTSIER